MLGPVALILSGIFLACSRSQPGDQFVTESKAATRAHHETKAIRNQSSPSIATEFAPPSASTTQTFDFVTCEDSTKVLWAHNYGRDEYGLWAELEVRGTVLRLRCLNPATFWMGSPISESGREQDETLHQVELRSAYWLGATEVTNAQWLAIMEQKAPSRFTDAERPVESVSWFQAQNFVEALNRQIPSMHARLPTETEWEFACRAGTMRSTYIGDLQIVGERNAPILDSIAWYGGNSGVVDVPRSYRSSNWHETQKKHARAATHPVREKSPNTWGLYDMLGNVSEWCSNHYYQYNSSSSTTGDQHRVARGGSWFDGAKAIRAAPRTRFRPGDAQPMIGLRIARDYR